MLFLTRHVVAEHGDLGVSHGGVGDVDAVDRVEHQAGAPVGGGDGGGVDADFAWPDFSEQALLQSLEDWLQPWLKNGVGVKQLRRIRLDEVLRASLGWEAGQRLDRMMPTHFATPAGTRRRIEYPIAGPAVLAAPLQELLGLSSGPLLADGRIPLQLKLLSPAGRPLQITTDLAAFWRGAYAEVRKEMKGRYPKHFWPEDPASARATRFTKRRMQQEP